MLSNMHLVHIIIVNRQMHKLNSASLLIRAEGGPCESLRFDAD